MIIVNLAIHPHEIEPGNFHLFVKAKIGSKNARLLLDTGASKTAFDSSLILKFIPKARLRAQESQSVGLGSNQVETQLSTLPPLRFGDIVLYKQEVAVLDLQHVNMAYEMMGLSAIDGVLGSDILYQLNATISYPKMELKLKLK